MKTNTKIILASKSPSRALILKNAGVSFEIKPAGIDEGKIKTRGLKNRLSPGDIGMILAREKGLAVSKKYPAAVTIGADQILEFEGEIFDKPKSMKEAREVLEKLRGKTHTLISCVVLAKGDAVLKEIQKPARLTMREFSNKFLDRYLAEAGEMILASVGAYQLEGPGAALFEKIEGDFFTILGLPLLEVLAGLHHLGVIDDD